MMFALPPSFGGIMPFPISYQQKSSHFLNLTNRDAHAGTPPTSNIGVHTHSAIEWPNFPRMRTRRTFRGTRDVHPRGAAPHRPRPFVPEEVCMCMRRLEKSESNERVGRGSRDGTEPGMQPCTTCQKRIQRHLVFFSSGPHMSSYLYDLIKSSINGGGHFYSLRLRDRQEEG